MSLDVYLEVKRPVEVYQRNITHNLNEMARQAGIYQYLWRPDELSIKKAGELIPPLKAGLLLLENNPARFKKFNPENGWGSYEGLLDFLREYLAACERYPESIVRVSR